MDSLNGQGGDMLGNINQKFAGPPAQCVVDLVFAMLAILGGYRIPPRAKRAPPWGDPPRKWSEGSLLEVPLKSP